MTLCNFVDTSACEEFAVFSWRVKESMFLRNFSNSSPYYIEEYRLSYIYWTVHRLVSWAKRDQLDVTCFIISLFNAQHVSDVNTSILRSLRLICWVISCVLLIWFDVCWCYVVVWLWWFGIRMQAQALVPQPAYGYHTTPAKPQRNTNTHRTRAIQPMK